MKNNKLCELIHKLQSKPRHENVRFCILSILKNYLNAEIQDLKNEFRVSTGEIDTLWQETVFEFKSDLKKEKKDAENQLQKYIIDLQDKNQKTYIGIATDGLDYFSYFLDKDKSLKNLSSFNLNKKEPEEFLRWLESVVLCSNQLEMTSERVCQELGKNSHLCKMSLKQIHEIWGDFKEIPDVKLKLDLWRKLVTMVYGKEAETELFLEHTYLTIVSKSIANASFFKEKMECAKSILNGTKFKEENISGLIEKDFFNWILESEKGLLLVKNIYNHVRRFDFSTVNSDLLKELYEELIDIEQRHKLGEYYTPDWLAEKICKEVIADPLNQKVIDPSCGSGTFLFHAIKHFIKKAKAEYEISSKEIIKQVCNKVMGIDIHPVANIFARVTYLLAILDEIQKERPRKVIIPVYLGDSLQWSVKDMMGKKDLEIFVPEDKSIKSKQRLLIFPYSICSNIKDFNKVLEQISHLTKNNRSADDFKNWFKKEIKDQTDINRLTNTYQDLLDLYKEKRNHIWGYVARNLTKPIWLSNEDQKADIIIGNPPWLKYNSMSKEMQKNFKNSCKEYGIWSENRKLNASQDLSKLFFAKSIDLYLKKNGKIAFVMPIGAIIGDNYINFIKGNLSHLKIKFNQLWRFGSEVKNLFKIPSCVLFSQRRKEKEESFFPIDCIKFSGKLNRKNTTLSKANSDLKSVNTPWSPLDFDKVSFYHDQFLKGACLTPRRLVVVKKLEGSFGKIDQGNILVEGITSGDDKFPWNKIESFKGKIESQFIKKVYISYCIAPFKIINEEKKAIIPVDTEKKATMMNSNEAYEKGFPYLGDYLKKSEDLWDQHGTGNISFKENLNYQNKIIKQFPLKKIRVVYNASGNRVCCTTVIDTSAIIDSKLYYFSTDKIEEALYLEGVLNSESLRLRFEDLQSEGNYGKRDISRHLLKPDIPQYETTNPLHKEIVQNTRIAKDLASRVDTEGLRFTKARKEIRKILDKHGIMKKLDDLVDRLLNEKSSPLKEKAS